MISEKPLTPFQKMRVNRAWAEQCKNNVAAKNLLEKAITQAFAQRAEHGVSTDDIEAVAARAGINPRRH